MIKIGNPEKFRENVKCKFSVMLNDEKLGDNLERGIYNNTLQTAEEKHIVKKWKTHILHFYILINLERYTKIYYVKKYSI